MYDTHMINERTYPLTVVHLELFFPMAHHHIIVKPSNYCAPRIQLHQSSMIIIWTYKNRFGGS